MEIIAPGMLAETVVVEEQSKYESKGKSDAQRGLHTTAML